MTMRTIKMMKCGTGALIFCIGSALHAANTYSYDPDDAKSYIVTVPSGEINSLDSGTASVKHIIAVQNAASQRIHENAILAGEDAGQRRFSDIQEIVIDVILAANAIVWPVDLLPAVGNRIELIAASTAHVYGALGDIRLVV
jgi:hypothetical protein